MSDALKFKRGDTLSILCNLTVPDPTGVRDRYGKLPQIPRAVAAVDIASEVRDGKGTLIGTFAIEKRPDLGIGFYTMTILDTRNFPLAIGLAYDVQYVLEDGTVISTDTRNLVCVKDITQ